MLKRTTHGVTIGLVTDAGVQGRIFGGSRQEPNHNKAACALANKLARICYAALRDQQPFDQARLTRQPHRPAFPLPACFSPSYRRLRGDRSPIMANRVHPTPRDADNTAGKPRSAAANDWRRGVADSISARAASRPPQMPDIRLQAKPQPPPNSFRSRTCGRSPYTPC